jgi:hypothetical protein
MSNEELLATDEQVAAAIQLLRGHAIEDGPRSPVSITTLLHELGVPYSLDMQRLIDLIYRLWEHPNVNRVNDDWIEFIWEGGLD